jgi:hypothetical protein
MTVWQIEEALTTYHWQNWSKSYACGGAKSVCVAYVSVGLSQSSLNL